jgi:hypothetical protein
VEDAFEDGEVVEHFEGGDAGVDAELLGQVAEDAPDGKLVAEHVGIAEEGGAGVGVEERGEDAHEGGLAGAVRAEESVHAGGDGEGDAIQGADAVGVGFREGVEAEVH